MARDIHPLFLLPADRPRISRVVAFILGSAMSLGFAPFGWSLLLPLLLLPLLYVCKMVSPRDAGGHARPEIAGPLAPGLQAKHPVLAAGAQPVGHHRTGRPGPDDDVIIGFRCHETLPRSCDFAVGAEG